MEKHTNKKLFAGILALSCAFVMSACDPVESLPGNYNDPILAYITEDKTIDTKDNIMGEIYNKISSDKNDKVLQIVLNELAYSKYGTYKDVVDAKENDKVLEYAKNHKEFFIHDDEMNEADEITDEAAVRERFDDFYWDIMSRISEYFYNLINSGSYNNKDNGMFSEKKLYDELVYQFWDLKDPQEGIQWKEFYVTKEVTKENAFSNDYLHTDLYSVEGKPRSYIEENIYKSVLKDKMVEEYIFTNNYSTLGRSYARKANFVKISYESKTKDYISSIVNQFLEDALYGQTNNSNLNLNYDAIQEAIIGFDRLCFTEGDALLNANEEAGTYNQTTYGPYMYNDSFKDSHGDKQKLVTISTKVAEEYNRYFKTNDGMFIFPKDIEFDVFENTKLGSLLASYKKAIRADKAGELKANAEDKTELDKFNTGKSMPDVLREKILALAKENWTTNDWFVKNGGATELPSVLRDRLFNLKVANDLDKTEGGFKLENGTEGHEYGSYRLDANGKPLSKTPYVRNINGTMLVMPAEPVNFDNDKNNFVYDDASALYICQVLEAPSTLKLNKDKDVAYKDEEGNVSKIRIEQIARQIAKVLSTKDTFITNAYTEYLKEYKFLFNDTSLADYFKGQYPDLFDDED